MMRHQSSIAISLLSLSVIAGVISAAPSVAEPILKVVKPAAAGRTTGSLANTILSGNVAPKSTLGIDGDFYIDIKALNIYGPKVSGKWPAAISLRGATGATGAPGAMGLDGDDGAIGKTGAPSLVAGAPGSAGAIGATGPKGEAGASGAVGPPGISGGSGAIGATGPSGAPGMAGTAGSPGAAGTQGATGGQGIQGVQGSRGDAGVQGEKGLQGNAGIKGDAGSTGGAGVKGDTGLQGATGAAGPSRVQTKSIPAWTLSTSTAGSHADSTSFGDLAIGSPYRVTVIGKGSTSNTDSLYLSAELVTNTDSCVATFASSVTYGKGFYTSVGNFYYFQIEGTVQVSTSACTLSVRISDGLGGSVDSPTVFSGLATIQLIGQIG